LTWNVPAGTTVTERQEIGEIESSKAVSGLYAPADGAIVAFNGQLLDDPSAINADSYGAGWLYDFRSDARFLTTQEYVDLLAAGWENTQRMLKGQMNR
jgi:glycine cleavage system H protein